LAKEIGYQNRTSAKAVRAVARRLYSSTATIKSTLKEELTMKNYMIILILLFGFVFLFAGSKAAAQDPVKVDAKHYKVEFENDKVRVLRITYGPGEKSVMHDHPESIAIFLTDQHAKFTDPAGKTEVRDQKSGDAVSIKAGKHLPENISNKPLELILVELKQ
jgi:quercetin dioxygenase-like cupin family protein